MIAQQLLQSCQVLPQRTLRSYDWARGGLKHGIAPGQLLYAVLESPIGNARHLQGEVAQ